MRQVIRRFLKHLDTEKNASLSTIQSYRYDLTKFDDYLLGRLGDGSYQGMFLAITFVTISSGSRRSVIKSQTAPRLVRARLQPSGRFSNMPIVQVY